jgi:acetylornithine deacetylase/succinyl-diaminopimelate desuccinylase-like protein
MSFRRVHEHIDRTFPEHLRRIQEFLRIPSTAEDRGLKEAARWVADSLRALGGQPELVGPEKAPVVFARLDAGRPKTLLVYGMYDVQPVDGRGWSSPPFAAAIRDRPGVGPCLIARGACNSKGPLAAFLNALRAIREAGQLPVNLVFTVEGEEESGSPFLPRFYRENRDRLRVDAAFEPFWAEYGTDVDRPTVALGTKGIVSCEVVCRGGAWGGPTTHPVHSSAGAWLASPTWRLLKALSTLLDEREEIAVLDFNAEVLPPRPEDEALLANLEQTFDERRVLEILGARRFKYDLRGVDLLRRYLFSPALQVLPPSQPAGDIIPAEARGQVIIRLVPDMDPAGTVDKVRRHLADHGYGDLEVRDLGGYPASRTGLGEKVVQSLLAAYRFHGCEPQVWPLLASATPYYLFSQVLGVPYTFGGLGRAGGSHSVDEFASVASLPTFEKSLVTFLYLFGGVQ